MRILPLLIGGVLGLAAGAASAFFAAGMIGSGASVGDQIDVNGWKSDWTIGSTSANPWTRARIARHGLLALTKEEAVYFTTNMDSDGNRLSEDCTYEVSGGDMPGQWWSITLYDAQSYLPLNKDNALSFDQTKAASSGAEDAWSFTVAATDPETGNWVSSQAGGDFDMTLRIYRPTPDLIADPEGVLPTPGVKRLACGGDA
ncbi:conserved hypothetical protein [Hyphomonas neptunium ATCC 15444]|uniref:DUF1214 domain-containing protein n=2 Tax=Hyphomonas TaxID=85 RepID=Q0C4J1_HYPNA|nr:MULTISPECIES: DUF1214 domain-containing protein [Hyphomonas]ABI76312.1 conserved hypothetical protein [Hyphomonas neptunium ATCC 15444]KCZ96436.1 hypothetical protein HHI_02115 [Hyphomonas hirschiana VP5]